MRSKREISVIGLTDIGEVTKGTDLGQMIYQATLSENVSLQDNDVIVVTQKIVSKAEGRLFRLSEIEPSPLATEVAKRTGKDPAIVELILRESRAIVRMSGKHLITQTKHGLICANAGVDVSNVSGGDSAALLPVNPDKSARIIRETIQKLSGKKVAVIISDTFGRPFRIGHTDVAIGCS
ncbi:coenzyme F420-0:L-glutamate ligase, partial [Candidatus Bathyarchaeota archaeon]|nr:coenzyme F420-0:L-glutamate ligase [Candidatus Bathyarchaeota archaeon]